MFVAFSENLNFNMHKIHGALNIDDPVLKFSHRLALNLAGDELSSAS